MLQHLYYKYRRNEGRGQGRQAAGVERRERMIEITMDEWEKMQERAELKKVVDKTIKSIANEIQEKDIMPGQYPDTIRALAELITARAALR